MTRSNRLINRVILGLVGILLLAGSAYLLGPQVHDWMPAIAFPRIADPTTGALWAVAAIAVVVVILSLSWMVTRGRGRISRILTDAKDDGSVVVDARVVSDLVGNALGSNPDVVAVGASAFRVRGSSVLSIRVTARRGSDLRALIRSTETIISNLDEVIEQRLPVLLQVASGLRATVARDTRTR